MSHLKKNHTYGKATLAIHAGQAPEKTTGAVMTPIFQTSTYAQASPGVHQGYDYSRGDNPTRTAYQECLAALEGAKHALAFSSGLAAIDAVMHTLKSGDHVICSDDVYGGTFRLYDKVYRNLGLDFTFVDLSKPELLERSIKPNTKLVWMETPTNPLLKISDIKTLSAIAKQKGIIAAVDNTFASPMFQNPLKLGASLVMHSVTKYINGHSDVIGGALMLDDSELYQRLKFFQFAVGAVPAPMDCFLTMRGIKTLPVRMKKHEENAKKIVQYLGSHSKVEKIYYPGLESHPGHAIARTQMTGFGGMISFNLKTDLAGAKRFLENCAVFTLAESLGGVESLIEHPAIMTHASVPAATREQLGIKEAFIRVSVGIEDEQDLLEDLEQALKSV